MMRANKSLNKTYLFPSFFFNFNKLNAYFVFLTPINSLVVKLGIKDNYSHTYYLRIVQRH